MKDAIRKDVPPPGDDLPVLRLWQEPSPAEERMTALIRQARWEAGERMYFRVLWLAVGLVVGLYVGGLLGQ